MKRVIIALVLALTLVVSLAAAAEFDINKTINVVSREEGSGTRGAFIELTGVQSKNDAGENVDNTYAEADFVNGTSLVITTVGGDAYAIGYASLASVENNETVKMLQVNDVEANTQNINDKSYPIARPFNIVTKGELENELAIDFFSFIMSKEGQEVVAQNGLVPVATEDSYTAKGLEGMLNVGGSTSVAPVMEKLKEAYEALNPKADIQIQSTGSTAGVTGPLDGTYDIGMASRELKDSEVEAGAVGHVLGMDGIAVIVHPDNPTQSITMEQVRAVFVGEVTTWDGLNQ